MENACRQKNAKFECEICNFICYKKSNYESHVLTKKHTDRVAGNLFPKMEIKKNADYNCECGKAYSSTSGLWKHKMRCNVLNNSIASMGSNNVALIADKIDIYGLVKYLMKENTDLKTMMVDQQNNMMTQMNKTIEQQNMVLELAKSNSVTSNSNNTTNSHNKAFNLNFFLNETCKDAMNISEFIENIKIDVSDLENMGRVGYVEGMSNILIKNLNVLDVTKRPIHCTDKKREILYIKDNNIWEKDDEQKNKLHKTIKRVSHKNIKFLPAYREKYPGCEFAISRFSDNYNKMIIEVMGGPGDNDTEKEDKIIQKIAKYITINKS